jgi:hypothetical protein
MTGTHISELRDEQHPHTKRAKGGHVRAERMTPEERSESARRAATARWDEEITDVICGSPDQPLRIGDIEIECYVLEDDTRVLTQASFLQSLGRHRRGQMRTDGSLPVFLQGKAVAPFISEDVQKRAVPITFRRPGGGRASGFNAELLPDVCEIYLKARELGVLPPNQQRVAHQAEVIMRGLARVGIVALVDEATGYQAVRERNALAKILESFIDKELRPWVQTFPDDFYKQLFRLRGLEFTAGSVRRPQYFGNLTNDIVYKRIAPGVLDELKRVMPKDEKGRRRHKLFQKLTQNVGYPKLREHLGSVVTIMKLSRDWDDFMTKLDRLHPRFGDNLQLPFEDDNGRGL